MAAGKFTQAWGIYIVGLIFLFTQSYGGLERHCGLSLGLRLENERHRLDVGDTKVCWLAEEKHLALSPASSKHLDLKPRPGNSGTIRLNLNPYTQILNPENFTLNCFENASRVWSLWLNCECLGCLSHLYHHTWLLTWRLGTAPNPVTVYIRGHIKGYI